MIRISNFSLLVKTFLKIFFLSDFRLSNSSNCLSQRLLKRCLEFMSKELITTFSIPMKEKISLKAKDLLKGLLPLPSEM